MKMFGILAAGIGVVATCAIVVLANVVAVNADTGSDVTIRDNDSLLRLTVNFRTDSTCTVKNAFENVIITIDGDEVSTKWDAFRDNYFYNSTYTKQKYKTGAKQTFNVTFTWTGGYYHTHFDNPGGYNVSSGNSSGCVRDIHTRNVLSFTVDVPSYTNGTVYKDISQSSSSVYKVYLSEIEVDLYTTFDSEWVEPEPDECECPCYTCAARRG